MGGSDYGHILRCRYISKCVVTGSEESQDVHQIRTLDLPNKKMYF